MDDAERNEFLEAWGGWCFDTPGGVIRIGDAFCTESKGHKDGHVCEYDKVDRYNELRLKARAEREVIA